MKEYYIHSVNGQVGPLTFDLLKQYSVKRETLVWFEGMEDWQKAGTIEELASLFKSVPPPIAIKQPPILPSQEQEYMAYSYKPQNNAPSKKNIFLYIFLGIVLLIGISAFTNYKNNEARNIQNIEQARIARENRIREIKADLPIAYQNLELAKKNLDDVSAFKLLRSARKRHEQISEADNIVASWQNKVNALEAELTQLSNQ